MTEKAEKKDWKEIPPRYMMATIAIHKLGNISRETPQLCNVYGEDDKNFIGSWVEGFGFINVKFPKEATRDLTEKEKKNWNGKLIAINDTPAYIVRAKGNDKAELHKDPPIIILPEDKKRRQQLKNKLEEYEKRISPHRHPGLQMHAICKKIILERLLKEGEINTWNLSLEMAKTYGSDFNLDDFNDACGVIDDYCQTGGANVKGGTGLPKIN